MTNLIAMTTVQNFGVMLLAPFAFLACWSLVRLMKEARREIIPWVIIIVAVVGAIMLNSGCKPLPTDTQEPTPTPSPEIVQRVVRYHPIGDGWYSVTVSDMAGNVLDEQQAMGGCRVVMAASVGGQVVELPGLANCDWVKPRKGVR